MAEQKPIKYVVAVRREARHDIPKSWVDDLAKIAGLLVQGNGERQRVIVEARDEQAIDDARAKLGRYCHFEPLIVHKRSSTDR